MAAPFPGSVSAFQVGSYFVSQYYHFLQQQPDLAHQFYTDASTMVRVDGDESETATTKAQFHSLVMSLNFTGIEIKTLHSLDSWNDGVLVMVSGSVQTKDFNGRRKFMQTFFLAPQEKGYFVLNDIFHFLDAEQIHQHSATILAHGNFDTELNATNPLPEPVSDYILEEETQSREFVPSAHVEENDVVDKYSLPEALSQVSETDNIIEEAPAEESSVSYPPVPNNVQDPQPFPVEEPVAEPPKHTYASILRVAKGPTRPTVAHQASLSRTVPSAVSDWQHAPQPAPQQHHPASSVGPEVSNTEAAEEVSTLEEGEGRSVYVRNLPSTVSVPDIELELKNFGIIRPDGIVIRNRKDIGVCYAFVEFEDAVGVQNAIRASPIHFGGRQVHIEERRGNSSSSRGGRRGRARGGYQAEGPQRGRFGGRTFGRGGGLDGGDREYSINRQRGNGFHQRGTRQERGLLGSHESRNGSNPYEASAY